MGKRMGKQIGRLALLALMLAALAACGGGGSGGGGGGATPDFTLSLNPTSLTVQQGNSGTTQLTLTPQNGFTGNVSLTLERQDGTAAPAGITLSPASVSVPGPGAVNQNLTLNVDAGVATGTYNLRVKGTAGSLVKTANFTLTVSASGGGGGGSSGGVWDISNWDSANWQ
jgi:hypothetical protein